MQKVTTDNTIKVLITGDFCPINRTESLVLNNDYKSIFNDFIDVFENNDLNIVDLECPLTLANNGRPKSGPYQKAHPDTVQALKYANVHLVAMANNHIMDYGLQGAKDTLDSCKQNNIQTIGIGASVEMASKSYSLNAKGKKIAFLNVADNEFLSAPGGALTCSPLDPVRCSYDIKQAKLENDFVFVIVHAGNEFYELPSPRTKKLYRYLVDQGADAVVAHHTHAFSGYEIYNSHPIFYGLGNFVYDWPGKRNGTWNKGFVVKFYINKGIEFDIIPLVQSNDKAGVFHLEGKEKEEFNNELKRLNDIIANDQELETEFSKYCNKVYPMYDAFIEPPFGKYIASARKRGLFPKFMSKKKRILLLNIIRCESHRDVLLRMLKAYE